MATEYEKRQAEWAKKEQTKDENDRKDEVMIGELSGKATRDIKTSDELKIKIDDVETLRVNSPVDLKKDDSVRVSIKADMTPQLRWGRDRNVRAGEAFGKVTGHIRKSRGMKVRIDNIETLKFESPSDIKKGDCLRVIIGKA